MPEVKSFKVASGFTIDGHRLQWRYSRGNRLTELKLMRIGQSLPVIHFSYLTRDWTGINIEYLIYANDPGEVTEEGFRINGHPEVDSLCRQLFESMRQALACRQPITAEVFRGWIKDATPTVYIGIDPSTKDSGWAWRVDDGPVNYGLHKHIEMLEIQDPLQDVPRELPIYVVIECPSWKGFATDVVRSSAIAWERYLHRRFPKRSIHFVDPRDWQKVMLHNIPGVTTKDRALLRCKSEGMDTEQDDMADAICILLYAGHHAQGLVSSTRGRKSDLAKARKQMARRKS